MKYKDSKQGSLPPSESEQLNRGILRDFMPVPMAFECMIDQTYEWGSNVERCICKYCIGIFFLFMQCTA